MNYGVWHQHTRSDRAVKTVPWRHARTCCTRSDSERADVSHKREGVRLLVETKLPSASDPIWNKGAERVLAFIITLLSKQDPKYYNLANARYLLNLFSPTNDAFLAFVDRYADDALRNEWIGILSSPLKTLMSFVENARVALDDFGDPTIQELTSTDTCDFSDLRRRRTAFYVVVPEKDMEDYSYLLAILYRQLFNEITEEVSRRDLDVTVIMDEFGSISKIPGFASFITTSRKRRIGIIIILQDIAQAVKIYGKDDAQIILDGGIQNRVLFPGLGVDTCKRLQDTIGKTTITIDEDDGRQRHLPRYLLTADEIRTLPSNRLLFLKGNQQPMLLPATPFYKHWRLKRYAKLPPVVLHAEDPLPQEFIPLN